MRQIHVFEGTIFMKHFRNQTYLNLCKGENHNAYNKYAVIVGNGINVLLIGHVPYKVFR